MIQRVDGPRWSGSVCELPTRKAVGGVSQLARLSLDLRSFSRRPDSFLRLAIENQSFPMQHAIANKFQRALREISQDAAAVGILNSRPKDLTFHDVKQLFGLIEDKVAGWGTEKSRHSMAAHALKALREMPEPLGDGTTAFTCGFTTRFPSPPRSKQHAAERPFKRASGEVDSAVHAEDGVAPALLIDAIRFNSLAERDSKAYQLGAERQTEIAKLCIATFERHDSLVQALLRANAAGLPELGSRCYAIKEKGGRGKRSVLVRLSADDQLRVVLYLMARDERHLRVPSGQALPLTGISLLDEAFPADWLLTPARRLELLMSTHYLPAHIVATCLAAIQNDQPVNTEVLSSLTRGDVRRTRRGYRFVGIKGRTNHIVGREAEAHEARDSERLHFTSTAAIRAFDLLLQNAASIEEHLGITFVPLLSCQNLHYAKGTKVTFKVKTPWELLQLFCDFHGLSRFNTRYLRDLGLQTHVLSPEGNIYSAQALAGHADIGTTEIYVYTHVIRYLHMSNIRRFMDMLAASILWRTGRTDMLEQSGLGARGFELQLLFPLPDTDGDEPAVVDQWIRSNYQTQISLGLDELQQCAAQYQYYVECLPTLAQRNAYQFISMHVPRILTCLAMREVVLASPYSAFYRKFEKALA